MYACLWYDYPRGTGTKHKEYSKRSNPEPRFIESKTLAGGSMTSFDHVSASQQVQCIGALDVGISNDVVCLSIVIYNSNGKALNKGCYQDHYNHFPPAMSL